MGALLGQTHAFPFIPHMDREHILTAEPRDVLVAVRIQRLFGFISLHPETKNEPFPEISPALD